MHRKHKDTFSKSLEVNWRDSRPSPWKPSDLDVFLKETCGSRCRDRRCLKAKTCNFSHQASYFSSPIKFSVSRGFDGGLNPAALSCVPKLSLDVSENTCINRWKHIVTSSLIHANIRILLCAYLVSHQPPESLVPKRSFLLPKYWHFIETK